MNKILSYGLAAIATTLLAPPVFADKGGRGDGGGHGGGGGHNGGGGGGARISAPAHVSAPVQRSAPSMRSANVMRAPSSAPRFATQSQNINRSQPQLRQEFRSQPGRTFTPSTAQNRSFRQRNAPSVAFGGTASNNIRTRDGRTFSDSGVTTRGSSRDFRGSRPSFDTTRSWDRSRVHEWGNHRWRWSGGDWIILDSDLPYAYGGYYDDYGAPDTYSTEVIGSSSDSLAMSVQDRLTRLGYSPGPVDGVIGPQTRDALADFQNDNRLPATGNINTATLRALGL